MICTYGLTKNYGRRPALLGVDLAVPSGVVLGYLGQAAALGTAVARLGVVTYAAILGSSVVLDMSIGYRPAAWRTAGWHWLPPSVAAALPVFDGRDITVH